jgi:outer membrane protein
LFKNVSILFLISLLSFSLLTAKETATIALVSDGPRPVKSIYYENLLKELKELLNHDFDLQFTEYGGDWTLDGVTRALDKAYADSTNNIVLAGGILASYEVSQRKSFPIQTVVPFTLSDNGTMNPSLIFIDQEHKITMDIEHFRVLSPFAKLGVIVDEAYMSSNDPLGLQRDLVKSSEEYDFSLTFFPLTGTLAGIEEILNESAVDAVLVLPTPRLGMETFRELALALKDLKIPSFSYFGEIQVENGIMATIVPNSHARRLARRIALNVQDFLLYGVEAKPLSKMPLQAEYVVNEAVAEAVGLSLTWEILEKTRMIRDVNPSEEDLMSLRCAMQEALDANLDLLAEDYSLCSSAELVNKARAPLFPQVNGILSRERIDSDRARAAAGASPERSTKGKVKLSQVLYNDQLNSELCVEQRRHKSQAWERESFKQDLLLEAAVSYLEVLRFRAIERVKQENIYFSEANLQRAHHRVDSGQARKSEVYRWESEIYTAKQDLAEIHALVEEVENTFKRVLNRPQEEEVLIKDLSLKDSGFPLLQSVVNSYMNTPEDLIHFQNLVADEAVEQSPEIQTLNYLIAATDREQIAAERAYFLPKISAAAEASQQFSKSGAGNTRPAGTPTDRFEGTLSIQAEFPFFSGGEKRAEVARSSCEKGSLCTQRDSLIQFLRKNARDVVQQFRASYASIAYASAAAVSANKNLNIVEETYSRGESSVVDLIDAQTKTLNSEEEKSNTLYLFLEDLMKLKRVVGHFYEEDVEAIERSFMDKLEAHYHKT